MNPILVAMVAYCGVYVWTFPGGPKSFLAATKGWIKSIKNRF